MKKKQKRDKYTTFASFIFDFKKKGQVHYLKKKYISVNISWVNFSRH